MMSIGVWLFALHTQILSLVLEGEMNTKTVGKNLELLAKNGVDVQGYNLVNFITRLQRGQDVQNNLLHIWD